MARCPAHDDRKPSLSINAGDGGRALVTCHAGCAVDAVCSAIGLRVPDLFTPDADGRNGSAPKTSGRRSSVAGTKTFSTAKEAVQALERRHGTRSGQWKYLDASGAPVGLVIRWESSTGKDFRPVSRTSDGWQNCAMPTPRPLYGLPDLLAAPVNARVYVTEGEKAADAAGSVGLVATTSAGGAKAADKSDWTPLAGRDVVILPDHDEPGERYAEDVMRLATAAGAKSVRVVRLVDLWPEMPAKGDMADYVQHRGGDAEAIRADIESLVNRSAIYAGPIDGTPVLRRIADVKPEPVSWLWPGRFALGKLTLIAGDPGLGKSFLTLDMAARVSTGAGWPDRRNERTPPAGVLILSAEDAIADTIRPRLDAAGADVERIMALEAIRTVTDNGRESVRGFDLSQDMAALERAIRTLQDCRLVVIDPVTAYLGRTDSHKNAEIRGLLAPLSELAERHRVAVVAVTHLNKSGGGPAIYRAMGSLAFAAAARAAWAVSKDKADPQRRLLLPIKNNIAPDAGGLSYRIQPAGVGGCPSVAWDPDPVNVSADDALSGDRDHDDGRTERDDAAEWLRDFLADGPRQSKDVEQNAREAGYSIATLRRARAALGVKATKAGLDGPWECSLPAEDAHLPPKALTLGDVSAFGVGERLRAPDTGSGGGAVGG
ncbi:MAG: AAA family ATPase [Phycisphaeraceae bacterium]|nr:AAA family ATPase [Phycisphaeraceae bacterium]